MKHKLALATIALALLSGCANQPTGSSTAASNSSSAETPQIRKGMTKSQVLKAWGEPGGKQVSGSGEIWTYGGQRWKRMIPYAGPFLKVQTGKVLFGSNGRVKDYRLTDRGDMMSDMEGSGGGHSEW